MPAVTTIWTDFGGVLTPGPEDGLRKVAQLAGLPVSVLVGAMRRVAARDGLGILEALERGWVSQREWGRAVAGELSRRWVPKVDLGEFGDHWYSDRPFNTGLFHRLSAARTRGVQLCMLTNSVLEWEPHRQRLIPNHALFDHVIRSHEVGVRKPDPEIYRLAEHASGAAGAACLLIDDLPANCAAANARGWRVIHHRDTRDTMTALDDLEL